MKDQIEDSGLNPMNLKTAHAYLEYILASEGEIQWMHFDEAKKIEFQGKTNSYLLGFRAGFKDAKSKITWKVQNLTLPEAIVDPSVIAVKIPRPKKTTTNDE